MNGMKHKNALSIGIMTWYNHCNCGGNLQAYALKTTLNRFGHNAKFINYVGQNKVYIEILKRRIRRIFSCYLKEYKVWRFDRFQKKYLPETVPLTKKDLIKLNKKFDVFICGSDQIWAPSLFDSAYFLDFVFEKKKKVAYAPSIGLNNIPEELVPNYKQLLKGLDYISVREEKAEILLREKCQIDCCTVLDPTLLLNRQDYEKLEEDFTIAEDYIFCYFLNQNNWYSDIVEKIAKKYGYKLVIYSLDKKNIDIADQWIDFIYPELFLTLIHNAQAVVTDSYHGTIFSAIYHKPFVSLLRFSENDPICQNSRIYDLLGKLGLEARVVGLQNQEKGLSIMDEIDYNEINQKLKNYRQYAFDFLQKSLL